jgi:hypothetical protein
MLQDFVLETCNAPGTSSTVNLLGSVTGRRSFAQAFSSGVNVFYYMDDSVQAEWGIGVFTTGSPNTVTRATVLGNTAGTTARLNFLGTTRIYNEEPASHTVYTDGSGNASVSGALTCGPGGSFAAAISNPGHENTPSGLAWKFGSVVVAVNGSGVGTFNFDTPFPSQTLTIVVSNGDSSASGSLVEVISFNRVGVNILTPTLASGNYRVNYIAVGS